MIPKHLRIKSSFFKEKYPQAKKKYTRHFRIALADAPIGSDTCFAVVTSKKILKKAVLRHKNKRIILNIIRQYYPQFIVGKYVFIHILKDISLLEKKDIEAEIIPFLVK